MIALLVVRMAVVEKGFANGEGLVTVLVRVDIVSDSVLQL
jgi:hypothetical protein